MCRGVHNTMIHRKLETICGSSVIDIHFLQFGEKYDIFRKIMALWPFNIFNLKRKGFLFQYLDGFAQKF